MGYIAEAAKSLARAVAVGAIELVSALLFNAGTIFKALKGGVKGAAKAAAQSAKLAIKATAKSARDLAKIGVKGTKTAFKNGKIMLKSVKSGFAKGSKSIDDLAKRVSKKLKFNKFKIRRQGYRIQLLGHINPWKILATGIIKYEEASELKGKRVGDALDDAGNITKREKDKREIIIGWKGDEQSNASAFVQSIKSGSEEAKQLFKELSSKDKKAVKSRIGSKKSTYQLRKGIPEKHHPYYEAHHLIPEELENNKKIKEFLDSVVGSPGFDFQDGTRNGVYLPGKNASIVKGWENATKHSGSHKVYTNKVRKFLETSADAYNKELKAGGDLGKTQDEFILKLDRYLNAVKQGLIDGKVKLHKPRQ